MHNTTSPESEPVIGLAFFKSNKWPAIIFTTIFILSLMTGVYIIRQNMLSSDAFEELQDENVEGMLFLSNIENSLWELRTSFPSYATAGALAKMKIRKEFPTLLKSIYENYAECLRRMNDSTERDIFKKFNSTLTEYMKMSPYYFQLIDEKKTVEARIYHQKFAEPKAIELTSILKKLISYQQHEAHERSEDLGAQYEKTRNLMLIYLFIQVTLCLGLLVTLHFAQKKAEANLQMMSHNARMASLGEMSGNIAHEINNPLTIIRGKASMLLKLVQSGKATPENMTDNIEKIIVTSDRIAKIIKSMKSISRNADNDPFVPVALKNLSENIQSISIDKFRSTGIRLDMSPVPEIDINCRSTELEQVLFNLLNNSFDAVATLPEKWVRLDFSLNDEHIHISVTDSGPGIPPEIVKKLMYPFFTTKEVGKGTGLGLSISKKIIEAHHGRLFYDSACANTRFTIVLPRKATSDLKLVA